jgi:SNF2 family DNA or RNA helicase
MELDGENLQTRSEEKIDAMLEDKGRLSGDVIASGGEGWITELDNDQLLDLFSLGLS